VGINPSDYYDSGLKLHGHKCPAMPMGLRMGAAAMNALGVERAQDGQLFALVETGEGHLLSCLTDGVQAITGCTYGKGNIRKLRYGKWGLTLIDTKSGKAVRVVLRPEAIQSSKETVFLKEYRAKGIPASQIPSEVADPLVQRVLNAPQEQLMSVGDVVDYPLAEGKHSLFGDLLCESCGELVVAQYARVLDGRKMCIPCAEGEPVRQPNWMPRVK